MDPGKVECLNGHQLPNDFQHGPENREPCPSCGSTSRRFFAGARLMATGDVRAVGQVLNARWNVEAPSRTSFRVECARLERGYLVDVYDPGDAWRGAAVADEAEDAALAAAMVIAEVLRERE